MSVELDVNAAYGADFFNFDSLEEKNESQSTHFYKSIFVPPFYPIQFSNKCSLDFQNRESLKADTIVASQLKVRVFQVDAKNSNELKNENRIILSRNHAEVSYDRDDDGNKSLDASVSTSRETESGTVTGEIHGGVNQDKDGNTSTHFGGSIGIDF